MECFYVNFNILEGWMVSYKLLKNLVTIFIIIEAFLIISQTRGYTKSDTQTVDNTVLHVSGYLNDGYWIRDAITDLLGKFLVEDHIKIELEKHKKDKMNYLRH
jgi:hypothetical protein